MTHTVYIHGAWSSKHSFNYIISQINNNHSFIEYDCITEKLPEIIQRAKKQIQDYKNVILVGHSMGGIIALALANEPNVSSVITLASPLSGIKFNTFFRIYLMSRSSILSDITDSSLFIRDLHNQDYNKPIEMIVSCEGHNDYINEPSDGVVSVNSQVAFKPKTAKVTAVKCNHFEILLNDSAVEIIKQHLT